MKIQLLPQKHVRTSESLLGLGAIVLKVLEQGQKDLDGVWMAVQEQEAVSRSIQGSITLDTVVLAIDFLFAVGAVQIGPDGVLANAAN